MNRMEKIGTMYLLLAGACDGLTGIMLMIIPVSTLVVMGVATPLAEPVYMRWIGAFVYSVGFSYFIPFLSCTPAARRRRSTSVLETTLWIRVVIAVFSTVSILRGELDVSWIAVPLSDVTLATMQAVLLKLRVFEEPAT